MGDLNYRGGDSVSHVRDEPSRDDDLSVRFTTAMTQSPNALKDYDIIRRRLA